MSISITGTENILTAPEAKKFLRTHVVIAMADLKKVKAWAKKHGMLTKLKKELPFKVYPLAKGYGPAWGDR
jgi:hypothetical protein